MQVRASGSNPNYDSGNLTNALLYQNPTKPSVTTTPAIESTTAPVTAPAVLNSNQWGFAVPGSNNPSFNFDPSYTIDDPANTYANLPTTDTIIKQVTEPLTASHNLTFYYAAKVDTTKPAGTYSTTITYTVIGEEVPEPITYAKVVDGANFQDTTTNPAETCSALPIYPADGSTITMTDTRNSQQYEVRRLQDGNCWMVNNLKLGSTSGPTTLTPADTNLKVASWSLPIVNASGSPSTTNYYNQPIVDALLSTDTEGVYDENLPNSEETDNTSANFAGYYYNWCAATAGIPTASSGNPGYTCTDESTEPDDAQQDICPANWRLPKSSSTLAQNEFAVLNGAMAGVGPTGDTGGSAYANNWEFAGPFKGVFSGSRGSSTWGSFGISDLGSNGYSWSGSHYPGDSSAFNLYFVEGYVLPTSNYSSYNRFAVRCLVGS